MPTSNMETIIAYESKRLSGGSIKCTYTQGTNFKMDSQLKSIENSKIVLEFSGGFFKKEKATFAHRNVVNVFIVNELDT